MKVVARCPFHKDAGDAKGIACTRSCAFSGDGRENAENLLRQWCLMGRHVTHRACGPSDDSHKFLDPINEVLQERSVQDAELQQAMLAPSWIINDVAAQELVGIASEDEAHTS